MRLRVLSRASDLAVLQAGLVADALSRTSAGITIERLTRSSSGDRDRRIDLWAAQDKGLFTADLSQAIARGDADLAVHSWKDLPIDQFAGTTIAGTLERADPRDVLLVRKAVLAERPATLHVLSSSPRRAWQLQTSLRKWLPWPIEALAIHPVRGNVPTRLTKLAHGDADALVVAKAALDRLLSAAAPAEVSASIRRALEEFAWMVLPIRECPAAPAQGALAIEIASVREDVLRLVHESITDIATSDAVERERAILASFGGGCSLAVGATVLPREYGRVTSVRAHVEGETDQAVWMLETSLPPPPRAAINQVWPRPDERDRGRRRPLTGVPAAGSGDLWVARADAYPANWSSSDEQLVWAAGSRTWEKLAARGVWVNGCADGLGDAEPANVEALAGRSPEWRRLTHSSSGDPDAVATYVVEQDLPADLAHRTHFFWTSGSLFLEAIRQTPSLKQGVHASGPGRTARVIREALGPVAYTNIWLDYEQWLQSVTS